MKATGRWWLPLPLKCRPVSDLLESAAAALGIPPALAQRSAAARAAETGSSVDDILGAWTGGAPVAAGPTPAVATVPEEPAAAAQPAPAAPVAVIEAPTTPTPVVEEYVYEEEPEEPIDPVPLGRRLRTAVRVGAWSGAGLGLVGFLIASAFWADTASVLPGTGPIVQVNRTGVMIGSALISLVFGAVVAGMSRSAAAAADPGAELATSKASTVWTGAAVGLVLGIVAGAVLTGFGTPIETEEETLVQLPALATLAVMVIGGGLLGALTALVPQLFGTPVAVDEKDQQEVEQVRSRLGNAVSIPVAGLIILAMLVLPFAYILIRSNEMVTNGAAVIAILVAGGILGFAALAGSKPGMRISFGDLMVAIAGIGTILVILVAVFLFNAPGEEHAEASPDATGPGGTVEILATSDIAFDNNAWTSLEGEITLILENEGNTVHTLRVEGHEDEFGLRVSTAGEVDQGSISLSSGTYTLYCDIRGHRELGMEGTLTVEASGD